MAGCINMPRTLFITDAASPLGRACAIRMGRAGWNVVMGASSLSSLHNVCAELPDTATLPMRCVPTEIDNISLVLAAAEERFGAVDAVLANNRAKRMSWRKTVNFDVLALTHISDAVTPFLERSHGHLVITGSRSGPSSMRGAMKTVARNAKRTISAALSEDWSDAPQRVSLIEPGGLDTPNAMARRIARILNTVTEPAQHRGGLRASV